MRSLRKLATMALATVSIAPISAFAQDPAPVKIGVITFLSGPAASPFGVPARNAAEVVIEMLNAGKAPAPYATKGFGGAPIQTLIIDEAGSSTTQVTEYRNLVQRHNVDVVIGYVSSGNCLAVAPVARRRGIGGLLLDEVVAGATRAGVRSLYLEVRESNSAARALYESRRFLPVGRRRGYYQRPPEDALLLRRDLAPT